MRLGIVHRVSSIYRGRILRALNLHKKIEYTAKIAPAQLGKATVNRYRIPAATGWDGLSRLDLSADIGIQASIAILATRLLSWLVSCTEQIDPRLRPTST
jgi:hypothetical protein